ncbi:MAG: hypothetical protein Q7I97_04080 [Thermovirgaceae bacterium]|nr:hypothetical protein [Thermovirgaceae bacterium]
MQKEKHARIFKVLMRAAAGFFAVALLFVNPAFALVNVYGVPDWVVPTITGPIDAVWEEIGRQGDPRGNEHLLQIVIERLFPGLRIENARISEGDLFLDLSFIGPPPGGWHIRFEQPDLVPELRAIFADDIGDATDILQAMIAALPVESLGWGGQAFQRSAAEILAERLPGWSPSFIFMQARDGSLEVSVRFHPLPPVVVAYSPRISSRTLPRILQAEISDDALEVLSSFIGLPGAWVSRHERAIEEMAGASLESKWASREMRGRVTVGITPDRVAPVDIRVESERYTLLGWAAVSIDSDARHPEIGIHLGRKTAPFPGWDMELYGEWIVRTNDLQVESRWGARWSTWLDIWVGAEIAYPGEDIWYRFWFDEILRKVYLWGRFNEDGDSTGALGWRFGENFSWELYYDSRDGDDVRIRLVGNL